jgi:RNA ligase (TIGR02306 family)
VDAIVPAGDPRWAFLQGRNRIKARKLRGVFSMGLLAAADPSWSEGQDVREVLRVTKYEPPEPLVMGGENEKNPGFLPNYTDIDGLRRWPGVLIDGEEVVITEKIHGTNGKFLFHEGRLWVGSHRNVKKENAEVLWWKAAGKFALREKLARLPGTAFYGEVFGPVQDLRYGAGRNDIFLLLFDAFDLSAGRYLDYDDFLAAARTVEISTVPLLHRGPWKDDLKALAEGNSLVPGANHVREGIVIRPVRERFDERIGRVILKLHGEGYLLRKDA